MEQNPQQINLQVPPHVTPEYANMMQVNSTREEFVLDFLNVFPPQGKVVCRVVVSPGHLKRMLTVLKEVLEKYEGSYGKVEAAQEPVGFAAK